jgi:phosphoenolpyruvate carboxykinase (ATP)
MKQYDPRNFYSQEEIDAYLRDIVEGRIKYTEMISEEGLHDEVMRAAEKSFEILPSRKDRAFVSSPEGTPEPEKKGDKPEESSPTERFWKPGGRLPKPPQQRR